MNGDLVFILCVLDSLRMYSSSNSTVKFLHSIQPIFRKTFVRTLLNPFGSKPVEKAKDAHSNLLTDTEYVFELQHHTVQPQSMVNDIGFSTELRTLSVENFTSFAKLFIAFEQLWWNRSLELDTFTTRRFFDIHHHHCDDFRRKTWGRKEKKNKTEEHRSRR